MEPPPIQPPVPDFERGVRTGLPSNVLSATPDPSAWRDELSARLNRYRSRRKAPPLRYPSLRLPFGPAATAVKTPPLEDASSQVFESPTEDVVESERSDSGIPAVQSESSAHLKQTERAPSSRAVSPGAKIIEFPRFAWGPPPPPPDQLAEPVIDRPRILEVPDAAPPLPALGGITIEPAHVEETEKRPGIDIPLQSAPLGRRMLASLIDGLIIGTASVLFGFIFWKIALVRPPQVQLWSLIAGIPFVFWAAYQYLLIVHAGSTPGLHLARLQLSHFDGTPTRRSLRRWRVLASYLSAASLGMGYAWLFLDEDSLCWHDRITHTYLAPQNQDSKS